MIQMGAPKYSLQTHLWLSVQHDLMCIVFMWSEFVSAVAHRWQLGKRTALGFSMSQVFLALWLWFFQRAERESCLLIMNLEGETAIRHGRKAVYVKNVHSVYFSLKH